MSTFCRLFLAWIAIEEQKWEHELSSTMNCEFLVRREEINDKFLWQLSCNCSARAAVWSYVIASYLGSNRIFKIFNSEWSYDKMLIDWVRSGRTGKYLALGQEVRTSLPSVRTPCPRAKYFPLRPSHSVNKYIICYGRFQHWSPSIWNLWLADDFFSHNFLLSMQSYTFSPVIDKPTRVHDNSVTLIGNILVIRIDFKLPSGNVVSITNWTNHDREFCYRYDYSLNCTPLDPITIANNGRTTAKRKSIC